MNSLWFFFSPLNLSLIGRLSLRTLKMPLLFWDSSSLANFSSRNVKVSEVYEESHRIAGNSVYSLLSLLVVNGFTHQQTGTRREVTFLQTWSYYF